MIFYDISYNPNIRGSFVSSIILVAKSVVQKTLEQLEVLTDIGQILHRSELVTRQVLLFLTPAVSYSVVMCRSSI